MRLRLVSGFVSPPTARKKFRRRIAQTHVLESGFLVRRHHVGRLVLPHEPGIDIDAVHAILHRARRRTACTPPIESTPPLTKNSTFFVGPTFARMSALIASMVSADEGASSIRSGTRGE